MDKKPDVIHLLRGPMVSAVAWCGVTRLVAGTWQPDLTTCPDCRRALQRTRQGKQVKAPIDLSWLAPEKDFQASVVELAHRAGYKVWHAYDARRSTPGYPDLTMAKASDAETQGRLIFAELKTEAGVITPEQQGWLVTLQSIPGIECYVWRPRDWETIIAVLLDKHQALVAQKQGDGWPNLSDCARGHAEKNRWRSDGMRAVGTSPPPRPL